MGMFNDEYENRIAQLESDINACSPSMFAKRCKDAMELHENSWDSTTAKYEISIRNAVAKIFGDDPMGMIAFLAIYLSWNDVTDWVDNPQPCEEIYYSEK